VTTILAGLFAAALVYALFNWRRGLLLCFLIGFSQDPIRKVLPGKPVLLVVAVALAFTFCLVGVYLRGERLGLDRLLRWFPRLQIPALAFVVIVFLECLHTLLMTGGNLVLTGLGMLSYLSPPLALLLGERYCNDFADLRRWLVAYLTGASILAATVLLQFQGFQPAIFSSIGVDIVYGRSGVVTMLPGLMRSAEIAAWHLAAAACTLVVVAASAKARRTRWWATAGFLVLLVAVALTGRRKMIAEIVLFLVLFGFLVIQYRRGGSRMAQSLLVLLVVGGLGAQLFGTSGEIEEFAPYLGRSVSVLSESTERLYLMTIMQFRYVLDQNGFFGAGAGTGAQGSQYFGGGVGIVGGAAEGGLGKVLAELGVPGALILLWLGYAVARVVLRIARVARRAPREQAFLIYGLAAFLPANAAVFLTAHQVFGDPFILIVIGLATGSILAFPRIATLDAGEQPVRRPRFTSGRIGAT
jgi:hypothetical protein